MSIAPPTRFNHYKLKWYDVSGTGRTSFGANVSFYFEFLLTLLQCWEHAGLSHLAGIRRCHQCDGRASRVVAHWNRHFQRIMRRHNL